MALFVVLVVIMSLVGARTVRRFAPAMTAFEAVGLGTLMGLGVLMWVVQWLVVARLPVGGLTYILVVTTAVLAWALLEWRSRVRGPSRERPTLRFQPSGDTAAAAILVAAICVMFAGALFWPVTQWDSQAIWVGKARAIALEGDLSGAVKAVHPEYPIGLPLLMAGAWSLGGEPAVKLVGPMFAAALTLALAGVIGRSGHGWLGSVVAVSVIATPTFFTYATTAYADVPMAAAYSVSAIYLVDALFGGARRRLWLSAFALGVAALLRIEAPAMLLLHLLLIALFAQRRLLAGALYVAVFLAAWLPWQIAQRTTAVVSDQITTLALAPFEALFAGHVDIDRTVQILRHLWAEVWQVNAWGLAFPLGIGAIIVLVYLQPRLGSLWLALLIGNVGIHLYLLYSTLGDRRPLSYFLATVADRMILHWAPLLIFVAGMAGVLLMSLQTPMRRRSVLSKVAAKQPNG